MNRIRKFARKMITYKITYFLFFIFYLADEDNDATADKNNIERIVKLLKAHRSVMDVDYGFRLFLQCR